MDKQEPVAMRWDYDGYGYRYIDSGSGSNWQNRVKDAEPLYDRPREWVGLTEEESIAIELGLRQYVDADVYDLSLRDFARAIEAKLKELNT